jgi:hypothetical protein
VRKCYMRTPGVHSKNDLENDRAGRSRGVESLRRSLARPIVSHQRVRLTSQEGSSHVAPGGYALPLSEPRIARRCALRRG